MADSNGGDLPSSDTTMSTSNEQTNNIPSATNNGTSANVTSTIDTATTTISTSANNDTSSEQQQQQPRAKINISLKKKKKSKSTNNNSQKLINNNTKSLLADEYSTIAEEAEIISKRRKEEGDILVIPCKQQQKQDGDTNSKDTEKKQPLLARRLALLRQGDNNDGVDNTKVDDKTKYANQDEDEAVKLLIQSAEQKDNEHFDTNDKAAATSHGRGLVIAAPSENKLTTRADASKSASNNNGGVQQMNDEEVFQHELAHHAANVDPTSNVYANVSIGDFGSALLRGMGWTGGGSASNKSSSGNKGKVEEEQVKPRPHRLGLGAKPVPLPSSSSAKPSSSVGIHHRARRPEDVKRDEERLRQQEEEEKRIIEKKKLDVQYTLQNGSIVTHRDINDSSSRHDRKALIVQTAGVPGLNRILIQFEGESKEVSVTKGSVKLCSWDELKEYPFKKIPLVKEKKKEFQPDKRANGKGARKRDRSYSDGDDDSRHNDRRRSDDRRRERSRRHSDEESESSDSYDRRRSKKHKRKKRDRRSRSRSDSRERTRRKGSRKDKRRDRSRSPEDSSRKRSKHSSSHNHHDDSHSSHNNNNSASTYWLIPNIRVRLISKKIPKYYLQKGIVQDVMQSSSSSSSGPKAVLQMDNNGQVIDKVPERYLETALPKEGGMIIILESKDKTHHWKKGQLLEKSSKDGYGIVQLEEDLEVVKISLDGLAEWCGRLDD